MDIRIDLLENDKVIALIKEHVTDMAIHSPPESVHAMDLSGLKAPDVTLWSVWSESEVLGCGALKGLSSEHAEIKSMKTANKHLRKGVAEKLLTFILSEAKRKGFHSVSLETGSMAVFAPARRLYEKHGFRYCAPFADYNEDPYSVFMTKVLVENLV